jgi:hypothetical protein
MKKVLTIKPKHQNYRLVQEKQEYYIQGNPPIVTVFKETNKKRKQPYCRIIQSITANNSSRAS